ncbi:MAG: universal stress protein, partial [Planctomycetota bacterium]
RMSDEDLAIQFQHDAERAVKRQVEDAEASHCDASLHVGSGSPIRAIREGTTGLRPALLVLGSVSRRGLPGVVLGNTAQRVLDQIECSLLVLKPEAVAARLAELDPVR